MLPGKTYLFQVARNCRLTQVGKTFWPRSYGLALAPGQPDGCDDWDGDGDIKTCRVPLQEGAEQGHPDDAGVRQDGDAGQEMDRTPGIRVRRSAGRTYGMAFQHALVSYHCTV